MLQPMTLLFKDSNSHSTLLFSAQINSEFIWKSKLVGTQGKLFYFNNEVKGHRPEISSQTLKLQNF
uniref:Uncharacterized protein n=1 Tax=Arundo donax TaxID=35708 RepID=A0A0A9A3H7_ARUDO